MRLQNGHYHGHYRFSKINSWDYLSAILDLIIAKIYRAKSITFHLPTGVQFRSFLNKSEWVFVKRISKLASDFRIPCYWENTALCTEDSWILKEQSLMFNLKDDIDICFDTGHLILGSKNVLDARKRILLFLKKYSKQIKHLHLHENDLLHDEHKRTGKIISKQIRKILIEGRTYIDEVYE